MDPVCSLSLRRYASKKSIQGVTNRAFRRLDFGHKYTICQAFLHWGIRAVFSRIPLHGKQEG